MKNKIKLLVLAFNIGESPGFVNGPGMSLYNFLLTLSKSNLFEIKVYSQWESFSKINNISILHMSNESIIKDIINHDVIHIWSGLTDKMFSLLDIINTHNKPIMIGPNLLDTVNFSMERKFLDKASSGIKRVFSVNTKLQFSIAKTYQINPDIVEPLVVGPNLDLWKPPEAYGDYILWKGNAKHMVKDIAFGRQVESRLKKYKFVFLGDKVPYNYMQHINVAKKASIYFSTSLSETKGMALLEQWACGVPSVTHPKIYLHGENYKTGIITNRDVASYCEAIEEIVEDKSLRDYMSKNARKWVEENFRPQKLEEQYIRAVENAC